MSKRRNSGYWQDWQNVESPIQELIGELGRLPTFSEIKKYDRGLAQGISRHHGGLKNVAIRIGQNMKRKEDHYWENVENVLAECRSFMGSKGVEMLPSKNEMEKMGNSSLSRAIGMHGGFRKIRRLLGEQKLIAMPNSWKDEEYTIKQAYAIMEEYGFERFPTQDQLKSLGRYDIVRAIQKFHNGFQEFRKLLGEESVYAKRGTWQDLEHCISTVMGIMQEDDLDMIPSCTYIQRRGNYNGLLSAIKQCHGGFPTFRQRLNQRLGRQQEEQGASLLEVYIGGQDE